MVECDRLLKLRYAIALYNLLVHLPQITKERTTDNFSAIGWIWLVMQLATRQYSKISAERTPSATLVTAPVIVTKNASLISIAISPPCI